MSRPGFRMACLLKVITSGKQLEGGEALPKRAPKYKLSMCLVGNASVLQNHGNHGVIVIV
jgi:hypothetical protein